MRPSLTSFFRTHKKWQASSPSPEKRFVRAPETEPESSFVDTNVWLYAFIEGDDRQKSARAKLLIEASRAVIVSIQVINEM